MGNRVDYDSHKKGYGLYYYKQELSYIQVGVFLDGKGAYGIEIPAALSVYQLKIQLIKHFKLDCEPCNIGIVNKDGYDLIGLVKDKRPITDYAVISD